MRFFHLLWVFILWLNIDKSLQQNEITCDRVDVPNTDIDGEYKQEYKLGQRIHYVCKDGYKGRFTRTCGENGWIKGWSDGCREITCRLENVHHADIDRSTSEYKYEYKYNEQVNYVCKPGYEGGFTLTCGNAGWIGNQQCTSKQCEKLDISNADLIPYEKQSYNHGERVEYACRDDPNRTFTITCELGVWTGVQMCEEITCDRVDVPNTDIDGESKQEYKLGQRIRYVCKDGYEGRFTRTCGVNGWIKGWSDGCRELTCRVKYFHHADIDRSTSELKSEYKYNEQVNYVCKPGYEGGFTLTCGNARWIGNQQCTSKRCEKLDINNADLIPNEKQSYNHGERVEYACRDDPNRIFTITCDLGVWTSVQKCEECAKPDVPHGFAVKINSTLYYTCDDGFKLSSKGWWGEAKCNDGRWSKRQQCIDKNRCGKVPLIPNTEVKPVSVRDQSIRVTCKDGYEARIPRLTCRGGKWDTNGIAYKDICQSIKRLCGPPPKIENAVVVTPYQKKYLSDSHVTYRCRNMYIIQGRDDTITCQDGQWEAKDIACTKILGCEPPPALNHGDVKYTVKSQYNHNERVEYMCQLYHTMEGEPNRICINGEWTGHMRCLDSQYLFAVTSNSVCSRGKERPE